MDFSRVGRFEVQRLRSEEEKGGEKAKMEIGGDARAK